jgi:hypothetical protein
MGQTGSQDAESQKDLRSNLLKIIHPFRENNGSAAQTKDSEESKAQYSKALGLLRDIRAEAQNLRNSVLEVKKRLGDSESDACSVETFAIHQKIFSYNHKQIDSRIRELRAVLKENPYLHSDCGDEVTNIENIWERIVDIWPDLENIKKSTHNLSIIGKCLEYLCSLIYHCNIITIPPRVCEHLKDQRPGHCLDFYDMFKDEVCEKTDGKLILEFLSSDPAYIDGVVDVDQGLIFKARPRNERWKSYAHILVALIFGGAALIGLLSIFMGKSSTLAELSSFSSTTGKLYIIIVLGAVAHIAIDAVKQMRNSTDKSFTSVEDWAIWIQIKEVPILGGILILFLGFALMVTSNIVPLTNNDNTIFVTYFITGYSIDSLGDLFLSKFDTIVSTKTDALKKTLNSL